MRKALLVILSLAVLALVWAALDDISTGVEPSLAMELGTVAGGVVWFAWMVVRRLRAR